MNKRNKILVGCLSLLLVLSVGYALFSETIEINGTATAKGSFDIVASCQTGIDSRIGTPTSLGWNKEEGFKNDYCTVSGNTVSMNTEFLYPGARRYFTISLKNNGTIDAVLDMENVAETEQICVSDDEKETNKKCVEGQNLDGFYGNYWAMYMRSSTREGIILEDRLGNIITLREAVANGMYDATNKKVKLDVGYTLHMVYCGIIEYEENNQNTSNKMFVDVNNTIVYTFEQATN